MKEHPRPFPIRRLVKKHQVHFQLTYVVTYLLAHLIGMGQPFIRSCGTFPSCGASEYVGPWKHLPRFLQDTSVVKLGGAERRTLSTHWLCVTVDPYPPPLYTYLPFLMASNQVKRQSFFSFISHSYTQISITEHTYKGCLSDWPLIHTPVYQLVNVIIKLLHFKQALERNRKFIYGLFHIEIEHRWKVTSQIRGGMNKNKSFRANQTVIWEK